jgi:uncharacterized protein with FMN-binding domain
MDDVTRARLLEQQETTTMKNVLWIVAVVLSLGVSANLAMAQSTPGNGITTGSAANSEAKYHDGEYTGDRTYGGGLPVYPSHRSSHRDRTDSR